MEIQRNLFHITREMGIANNIDSDSDIVQKMIWKFAESRDICVAYYSCCFKGTHNHMIQLQEKKKIVKNLHKIDIVVYNTLKLT